MIFECANTGLKIEIDQTLLDRMYQVAMQHHPREFGGILIGRYTKDMKTCIISDFIAAKEYKSEKYYFERGRRGLTMKLKAFYNQVPRLIYVGEWHTHPDMIPDASGRDKQTMKILEEHNDVNITSPLLLIISNRQDGYTFNFYVQHKKQMYIYGRSE